VALHSAPEGFFKTALPHSSDDLLRFVQKAVSLGFKAVQIGPLGDFVDVDGEYLRGFLDRLGVDRSVHVGGLYHARKFALTEEEFERARKQIHYGTVLCREIASKLVSIHPPFFATPGETTEELLSEARTRFLRLLEGEVDFAGRNRIRIALESFCYPPFIFKDLRDFTQFVSSFPSEKLGVLLDAGHVYQMGIDLSEAISLFRYRLLDVHVHDALLQKDFRKATHLPVGKGTMDFPSLAKLLRESGYDDWLTLEVRGSEREIIESRKYLENLIGLKV
jgi:sugar phosphate isomerase/epimerase